MSKVKQLMLMHQQGASNRQIARDLGLDKKTVNTYVHKVKVHELSINELLRLDAPILESKFMAGNKYAKFRGYAVTCIPFIQKVHLKIA